MRGVVTEQGLLIPKKFLEGVSEVEIRKEKNVLLIVAVEETDPVWQFGEDPVTVEDVTDVSVNHDRYLYGS